MSGPNPNPFATGFRTGVFGNGSDGAATLDGVATVAWANLAGSTYTMTRDAQLTSLIINGGVTLQPANYRVFAQQAVTNNGTISSAGNNAVAGTAGAAIGNGSFSSGSAGGAGGTGVSGAGANGGGAVLGVAGGAGGTGTSGAAGAGGTVNLGNGPVGSNILTTPAPTLTAIFSYAGAQRIMTYGAGGGGGGSDASSNAGGGGGGGGGTVALYSPAVTNNGTITVRGGNGAAGTAGNAGGGGGGSGGLIVAYTTAPWVAGTIANGGGSLGAGSGTGTGGANGGNGLSQNVVLS